MLLDIGWPEFLLIGVVALVVIGPKDLPRAMRVAGYWIRKARTLSREFQSSVDQMIREAELDEVREELRKASEFDIGREFHRTIDPDGSLADNIKSPELPDFFVESEGTPATGEDAAAATAGSAAAIGEVAPEAPLEAAMPEPDFVGFEPSGQAPETAP